jgi:hypothetical protein
MSKCLGHLSPIAIPNDQRPTQHTLGTPPFLETGKCIDQSPSAKVRKPRQDEGIAGQARGPQAKTGRLGTGSWHSDLVQAGLALADEREGVERGELGEGLSITLQYSCLCDRVVIQ